MIIFYFRCTLYLKRVFQTYPYLGYQAQKKKGKNNEFLFLSSIKWIGMPIKYGFWKRTLNKGKEMKKVKKTKTKRSLGEKMLTFRSSQWNLDTYIVSVSLSCFIVFAPLVTIIPSAWCTALDQTQLLLPSNIKSKSVQI